MPSESAVSEYVARPFVPTGAVAIKVVPSRKLTVPLNDPAVAEVTCAVKTTGLSASCVVGLAVRPIAVAAVDALIVRLKVEVTVAPAASVTVTV